MGSLEIRKSNVGVAVVLLALLYASSRYHYLLFHTIAEFFSVCIAVTVFLLTWHSRDYIRNTYLTLVGIAYLFIGVLDFFHAIAYKGMPVFTDYDYYANQLWIAARGFESLVLLVSFIALRREKPFNARTVFAIYAALTAAILMSVFVWKIFPECFRADTGLTMFKKICEYLICLVLLAALIMLRRNRSHFTGQVYMYLSLSVLCTILSEMTFTFYTDNYDILNLTGHYLKIFAFIFIYKTIIVKGIEEPFNMIFREMRLAQKELEEKNALLSDQVSRDSLTALLNHRAVFEFLEHEVRKCQEQGMDYAVMMIDIDHFKSINDSFGHQQGDEILKEIAALLLEDLSDGDMAGRYGGEEFIVMMGQSGLHESSLRAEALRKRVENHVFGSVGQVTVSVGVAAFAMGEQAAELVRRADACLYEAKRLGRNRVCDGRQTQPEGVHQKGVHREPVNPLI